MATVSSKYQARIEKIFNGGRERTYPKHQLIHYQGDPLSHIYLIKAGYVKAYTILDSGDTRTLLILGPGDIFPLAFSSSMDWPNYQIRYFYQSLSDTKLLALNNDVFKRHIEDDPEMMSTYMSYLAASNEAIMDQLEVMKNKKAIDNLNKSGKFKKPIVTTLEPADKFWPAEDFHQKFTERTGRGMCHVDYSPV